MIDENVISKLQECIEKNNVTLSTLIGDEDEQELLSLARLGIWARDHGRFLLNAAENLYRPNKPLHQNLDPTFYHTLTYEGDLELINKTKAALEALPDAEKEKTV